jgi:hypothetical protein
MEYSLVLKEDPPNIWLKYADPFLGKIRKNFSMSVEASEAKLC